MTEEMKIGAMGVLERSGDNWPRDEWQDWLESLVPDMTLEDFDEVWVRYEELKARRMAA